MTAILGNFLTLLARVVLVGCLLSLGNFLDYGGPDLTFDRVTLLVGLTLISWFFFWTCSEIDAALETRNGSSDEED